MEKRKIKQILLCATLIILLIFALWHLGVIFGFIGGLLRILQPFFVGGIIAFILNRPFEKLKALCAKLFPKLQGRPWGNLLPLLVVYLIFFALLAGFFGFVIPQVVESFNRLTDNLESYYNNFMGWVGQMADRFGMELPQNLSLNDGFQKLMERLPQVMDFLMPQLFGITSGIIGVLTNLILGLVISVYLLKDKRHLLAIGRKTFFAFLNPIRCEGLFSFGRLVSETFSNFINGQVLEALILGVLCFVGMNIFRFEYALMISVVIAITNLIPFIGPWIGTVPCTLILLMINPAHAFWFVVFILVLQQIESNLIYPRVVGTSVGLPALWVLVAVVVGGGLFGIPGMILGVPAISILYRLTRELVNSRLKAKAQ